MIVQCPQCKTSYKIADEKVPASGARMVCNKCEHSFIIKPPPVEQKPTAPKESSEVVFDARDETASGEDSDLFGSPDDLFDTGSPKPQAQNKKRKKAEKGAANLFDDSDFGEGAFSAPKQQSNGLADLFDDDEAEQGSATPDFDWDEEEEAEAEFTSLADGLGFEPGLSLRDGERLLSSSTRPADKLPGKPPLLSWKKMRRAGSFVFFLLVLAGAGGYVAVHPEAVFGLPVSTFVNELREMVGLERTDVKPPKKNPVIALAKKYYEITTMKGERLLVVEGVVRNISSDLQSFAMVRTDVLSESGDLLTTTTNYAGNDLNKIQLRTFGVEKIVEKLNREFGNNLINFNMRSGKKIPFMAVFYPVPEEYKTIRASAYIPRKIR